MMHYYRIYIYSNALATSSLDRIVRCTMVLYEYAPEILIARTSYNGVPLGSLWLGPLAGTQGESEKASGYLPLPARGWWERRHATVSGVSYNGKPGALSLLYNRNARFLGCLYRVPLGSIWSGHLAGTQETPAQAFEHLPFPGRACCERNRNETDAQNVPKCRAQI